MLAAHCPSCGSPAPVSLATPDRISCPSCRYAGAPSPEVAAQLRDAANALWAMSEGDRQLSAAQRYNLNAARSNLFVLVVVLLIVLVPLLGFAGSCSVLAASGEGFEPMSLVMFVGGCIPFTIGLGAAILAFRHVRNRGKALAERCLAAPPAGAGEPARCHVCGASLSVAQKQGVVRCDFCRADNLVSDEVLARMAARQSLEVGRIGEQVRAEGRALDNSALAAGLLAFVVALLSPIVSVVFVIGAIIVGSEIELAPRDDATYTMVQVTNAACVAEVRNGLDFRESVVGFERRPMPAGLVPKKSSDLVGKELMDDDGQRGRVKRVFRDAISPSIDRVELDIGGRSKNVKLTSRCEPPESRRVVATDARFEGASQLRLDGDRLWILRRTELHRVPKSGGAIQETLQAPELIWQFEPTPKGMLVLQVGSPPKPRLIERWHGSERENLGAGDAFGVDDDRLWIGNDDGLFLRDAAGTLTQVMPSKFVSLIHVTAKAVYWVAQNEIYERIKATEATRKIGNAYDVMSFVVVGDYVALVNRGLGPALLPLGGGSVESVSGGSFEKGRVQTEGGLAYFGLRSGGSRGGVAGLRLGGRSPVSDRHYGIDTGTAEAFTAGSGEVFWVSGQTLYAEPIAPQ